MSISPATEATTAEQFHEDYAGLRAELIEGQVVELPPRSDLNSLCAGLLLRAISAWDLLHQAGFLVTTGGYILSRDPDTVRAPDGGYIRRERVSFPRPYPYGDQVPDLVFEVVSPSDRSSRVYAKVGMWLEAGVHVVWVVWPETQRVWVCRTGSDLSVLSRSDTLTAEEVLPGFALPLEELFGALE
ncbi:MAG: Uma2 family endonuclease [Armatimonadetes bacterium]|nr:Uma2 family endonuclease [Armatimonadota bacterium]